jgi:hypothetical protein
MGLWLERDMSPRAPDVPEQVRQYAPKGKPPLAPKEGKRSDGDPVDQSGLVALLQQAAAKKPPPAPEEGSPRSGGDSLDQSGQAIVVLVQQAANLSNETCDRANELAGKLSLQLHVAEERINQLQAAIEQAQDRAARAEKWLTRICHEIEEKLIRSRQ